MQAPIKPSTRTFLIFARPLSQQDYERQDGSIETSEGPQSFTVGDFLMRHHGREYLISRENIEQEYCFVLGSRRGWGCYRLQS